MTKEVRRRRKEERKSKNNNVKISTLSTSTHFLSLLLLVQRHVAVAVLEIVTSCSIFYY
jgi:hypothetical protein